MVKCGDNKDKSRAKRKFTPEVKLKRENKRAEKKGYIDKEKQTEVIDSYIPGGY